MNERRIEITVKTCEQCPFFARGFTSMIADVLAKDGRKSGLCEYNGRTGKMWRMIGINHIPEPTKPPPPTCPMREGETLIKLASGV